ncbi:hypothetical protein [Hymenobacter sp. BT559]|uniref:hypothetical protein n=1 Tax=Hymenobacter sp. BT559 TaxID=2795729 RepID=UPI0018EA4773|nr:hypothetical protein [Hymenobacter sp. BT559]MBJ6146416.1 hypothetical protein [Hymenobacter sp. BT559]
MKPFVLLFLALLAVAGCTSSNHPASELSAVSQAPVTTPVLRRTYWPLDHTIDRYDTLLPGRERYRVRVVTTCLNDSAVVDSITEDAGPALAISHNYQSDLTIAQGQQLWAHAQLTKTLFKDNPVAQELGPVQEWALSRTAFRRHQQGQFVFYTRLGIPDSDIFMEAEVALSPPNRLRLLNVHQPIQEE